MTRLLATVLIAGLGLGLFLPVAYASKSPPAATHQGVLTVEDNANAFTPDGIKKAEDTFHNTKFRAATEMTVVTFKNVPEAKRADYEKVKANKDGDKEKEIEKVKDRARFFGDWTRELASSRGAKGIFVLVSMEGAHVHAVDDRATDVYRKFDDKDLKTLQKKITDGFVTASKKSADEAKPARDEGLLHGVQFVASELKNTTVPEEAEQHTNSSHDRSSGGSSSGIMGWICLGICVLLGIWLVIGLIRMFSGGGGGYGGSGGYGGGGGGFMTGLIGGMLGAAAGMYMYDTFMRDHNDTSAADSTSGNDGGDAGDAGNGDYDGGGDGGGTDYDDGADAGGDGGDFGGGDMDGGGADVGGGDW